MKKQVISGLVLVFSVILVLGFLKYLQISKAIAQNSNFSPPPEAVTSIIAKEESWQDTLFAVGSVSPVQGVILSAEEPGTVISVKAESGTKVNQGDLLVELDTSVEEGKLQAALARQELAQKNLVRMQSLKSSQAISKNDLDSTVANLEEAKGEVLSLQGLISRKKIKAPFAGTLGIRAVNVGQYLQAGTAIFPLYALDKVYIDFWLPQQSVSKIKNGTEINYTVDVYPDQTFTAKVAAINPQIDSETRNIKVQAMSDNTGEKLRPGMFVKVEAKMPDVRTLIAIPSSSVSFAPYGNSVFIIEKMKNPKGQEYSGVRQQIVEVGERRGEQVAILKGVKPGDEVVTSGVFKLRQGAAVSVNNNFAPQNKIDVDLPNT